MDKQTGNIPLIVIAGPTASGKTSVAVELSKHIDIEAISADSRQIFKYLDIGTATPDDEELAQLKHHFINIINPDEYYSAGVFADQARDVALDIYNSGKLPVVVGGSGLYIQALCEGLFDEGEIDVKVRDYLNDKLQDLGREVLYKELAQIDPNSADKYNDMNPRRIIRALEYYYSTGLRFSDAHSMDENGSVFAPIYFSIDHDRQKLYERINYRSELMWANGLIEETKAVLDMGYSKRLNSLNTVGYKETIAYLEGRMTQEEALELIKRNTRRYAKRQLTWFRRYEDMEWMSGASEKIAIEILRKIEHLLNKF